MMTTISNAKANGTLTEMEATVMNYLMTEGYYAEYSFSDIEVKDLVGPTKIDKNSIKGVVGSLVKKGYLYISEKEGPVPPLVYATLEGYKLSDEFETRWKPQVW